METTLDDKIAHRKKVIQDKDFNPNYNFITDFRDTHIDFSLEDVSAYIEFAKNTPKMHGDRRSAILTNTPNQTVFTSLYILEIKDIPSHVEIFSTIDAAIKWVGLSSNKKRIIESVINEMKTKAKEH
ncbi:MAG: hypothetical protein ACOH1N_07185 [Lutibacter sp.]